MRLLAKAAIAAAATMITLTPALADRDDHRHDRRQHTERSYGHDHHRGGDRSDYRPRHYGYEYGYGRHHHHHHRPHWMKRYYGWNYGYRPYRNW